MTYRLILKRYLIIGAITGFAGLGLAGSAGCSSSSSPEATSPSNQAHAAEGGAEKGDDHHDATPGQVHLSSEAVKQAGIKVATANGGSLRDGVSATAMVEHDIDRLAHVSPLVAGQIVDIRASLGERVEKGQTLAVMRSVELGEARAAVQEARAAEDVARQNFEREQKLVEKGIASKRALLESQGTYEKAKARLQAAGARLRTLGVSGGSGPSYPLRSPFGATIIEQHASLGETKDPGQELFVVADQSKVWVIGQVAETDAYLVKPGMNALVTLDAYPGRTWKGTVDWIASTIDPKTRLLSVRVELDNPKNKVKPGMFGTVELSAADSKRNVALVPVDAVQDINGKKVVFVPGDETGAFAALPVQLGSESGGLVEVLHGLKPGAKLVTQGAFDLKATLTARGRSAGHHD